MNPETPVGVMILHTMRVGWGRIASSPGRLAEAMLTNVRTFTLITLVDLDLPATFGVIRGGQECRESSPIHGPIHKCPVLAGGRRIFRIALLASRSG